MKTISDYKKFYQDGHSAIEVLEYVKGKIEENKDLNIFLEVYGEFAEVCAKRADEMMKNNTASDLTGIPIAIKDNICVSGEILSAGSKMLEGFTSPFNAEVVDKILSEGMIPVGRVNMDEFAMGSSNENSAYGPVKNPIDVERVTGGSSGGSAAAVSAGIVPLSLGSDTGGSVRQPASFCGCVGLKPTYGGVSRHGLISLSSSLDVIGIFAHNQSDAKMLFDLIKADEESKKKDSTACFYSSVKQKEENKVIGVPFQLVEIANEEIKNTFNESVEKLKSEGYEVVDIDMPICKYAIEIYYIIQSAEASSNLSRYEGIRYGKKVEGVDLLDEYIQTRSLFGEEAKRRMLTGTFVLLSEHYDAYYKKAVSARHSLIKEFQEHFKNVSYILTPTAPSVAFKFGEKKDPVSMYHSDVFTTPASLAGLPSISVPKENKDGLYTGIQITSMYNNESGMFNLAKKIED